MLRLRDLAAHELATAIEAADVDLAVAVDVLFAYVHTPVGVEPVEAIEHPVAIGVATLRVEGAASIQEAPSNESNWSSRNIKDAVMDRLSVADMMTSASNPVMLFLPAFDRSKFAPLNEFA